MRTTGVKNIFTGNIFQVNLVDTFILELVKELFQNVEI